MTIGCLIITLLSVLLSRFTSSACAGHDLCKQSQTSATQPLTSPSRELEWGDLNIIHTTDTHGWLLGHLKSEPPEPNYSGDFGDFQSFVLRMKQKAKKRKADLLVVDTGDLHDGNGLSDAEPIIHPGVTRGTTSGKFFSRVPYDILTIGNHELYDFSVARDTHENFAPLWRGSYLTSNVNITTSLGQSVPIGSRYRKFKTEQGRQVTAFGIIFHFTGNANGTIVQPPAELVLEPWFKEAIHQRPDLFLLAGHMGIADTDWKIVFSAIRALHPKVPIIILGGHLHIRDCRQLDDRSMSLASGRYMETIGWMSIKNLDHHHKKPKFSRRYLDANRATYAFHSGKNFDTHEGLKTSLGLARTADQFNITYQFGVAPQSFFGYRVAPEAKNSLNHLFAGPGGVLETVIRNRNRPQARVVVINTGAMRFDILAGNFTVNDEFITMPFADDFMYVPSVPRVTAEMFLRTMNMGGAAGNRAGRAKFRRSLNRGDIVKNQEYHLGTDVEDYYNTWLQSQSLHAHHAQFHLQDQLEDDEELILTRSKRKNRHLTYGYVTQDQCSGIGDDTSHKPMPSFDQPDYVGTALPPDAVAVDVVFFDFLKYISVAALNKIQMNLGLNYTYSLKDVKKYTEIRSNQILGIYAQKKWCNTC